MKLMIIYEQLYANKYFKKWAISKFLGITVNYQSCEKKIENLSGSTTIKELNYSFEFFSHRRHRPTKA